MKKHITILIVLLAAVLSLGAKNQDINTLQKQGSARANPTAAQNNNEEFNQVKKEAEPIIENILVSLKEKNYPAYSRDFNGSMKAAYPKDVFMKTCDYVTSRVGTYVSREFLSINKANQHYVLFYKTKFSRTQDSVTVRLILERVDKQLKVVLISYTSPLLQDTGQKKQ